MWLQALVCVYRNIYNQFTFLRQWIKNSYEFYDALRKMDDASHAGVTDISGYIFANSSQDTVRVRVKQKNFYLK